ncbi:hypothetical protein FPANT_10765 [Fusarium pseudoanthophilum]|uniref:Uncharacterized protein n=1 Tax=Fusarium pseudoanthophilum TaxID=48495 RepID=A0A8H5KQS4_9HYPO|nr:hypothetical protein FPANT_10765 [Fusarium pseudoanthophilum]
MSMFQALRRTLTTKSPQPHGSCVPLGHIPVHTTRPFRHVPVVDRHYRGDPQRRKEQGTLRIDREARDLDLEGDLLVIKRRQKGFGYRDSKVLDQLEAMYEASRESRWALKNVERKLHEARERKKAEDLEQELRYYRGWDKRRTVSDYTT